MSQTTTTTPLSAGLPRTRADPQPAWTASATARFVTVTALAALRRRADRVHRRPLIVAGSIPAISKFGIGFLWHTVWNPRLAGRRQPERLRRRRAHLRHRRHLGDRAPDRVPLGVAIGLFLSLLASGRVGAVVGPLVELLAAIPSVVLGLWGILVLAPLLRSTIEPALHTVLGWIPIFGPIETTGLGIFTAGIVLTIMVVPIIAVDQPRAVPQRPERAQGRRARARRDALGDDPRRGPRLDARRYRRAMILGLSRALGEAIAVTR